MEKLGHKVLTTYSAFQADAESASRKSIGGTWPGSNNVSCSSTKIFESSFGIGFETGYLLGATDKRITLLYGRELEVKYPC